MHHDVFLSHSSKDKQIADAVCASLEQNGIRVWVAPRDIKPGKSWAGSIVDAIETSAVMVIIFSENSNSSKQVMREIERAVQKDVVVVPFRIDTSIPTNDFEYFLSSTHWLDALTPELDRHLEELSSIVGSLLIEGIEGETLDKLQPPVQSAHQPPELQIERRVGLGRRAAAEVAQTKTEQNTKNGGIWKILAVIVLALLVGWFAGSDSDFKRLLTNKLAATEESTNPKILPPDNDSDKPGDEVSASDLLSLCESHFNANRLTSGASGNALDCYTTVLSKSPSNVAALAGLEKIETTYASWSLESISAGNIDTAESNLQKLQGLNPNHATIEEIQSAIKTHKDKVNKALAEEQQLLEADRQRRIEKQANDRRIAEAAEQKRRDEDAARKRDELELEQRRIAQINHQNLLAQEAERTRMAAQAERNRLIQEAQDRQIAETAKRAQQAKIEREKSIFGSWSGSGRDMSAGGFSTTIELKKDSSILSLSYPSLKTECTYRLLAKTPIQDLKPGEAIRFDAKKVSGACLKFRLRLTWTATNQMDYKAYKLGVKYAGAQLTRGN